MKKLFIFILLLPVLVACIREPLPVVQELSFRTRFADGQLTKTVLQQDGAVYWSPGDEIKLFYGPTYEAKFSATCKEVSDTTVFVGKLDGFSYDDKHSFIAAYPYDAAGACDGESVTLTLPDEQTAVAGSFPKGTFLSLARTDGDILDFYNVCGGIKFSVSQSGITRIILKGNAGETLAGTVRAGFDESGRPAIQEVIEAKDSIVFLPPEGESFSPGKWYYIVAFPASLEQGYTMHFTKNWEVYVAEGERQSEHAVSIKRSIWGTIHDPDASVNFIPNILDDIIVYWTTDGKKANLYTTTGIVKHFSRDDLGIHVLQLAENSKRVEPWLRGCTTLKEVVSSDNLREIAPDAFRNCSNLAFVSLADSLTIIGANAFRNCSSLSVLVLPNTIEEIGKEAFVGCGSLRDVSLGKVAAGQKLSELFPDAYAKITSLSLLEGITELPNYAYYGCDGLKLVSLPQGLRLLGAYTFYRCAALESIRIPDSVSSVGAFSFSGCSALESVVIEAALSRLEESLFDGCSALKEVALPASLELLAQNVFYGCAALAECPLPETLQEIGDCAFLGCASLKTLSVPATVRKIGAGAFNGCQGLTSISVLPTTPPEAGKNMFLNSGSAPIGVPSASLTQYKSANNWKDYASRLRGL